MAVRLVPAAVSIILLASAANAAFAQVTEYTDPTAYAAATSNSAIFTFNGLSPPGISVFGDVTVGNLSFSGGSNDDGGSFPFVVGSGTSLYNGNSFFTGISPDDAAEVLCTLSGSRAIGFMYGDFADAGNFAFSVTLSTGDSFALNTPQNPGVDVGFVGFVSDTPITSVTFRDAGQDFDVIQAEVSSGRGVGVPEPASLPLMAAGLLFLGVLARWRTLAGVRVLRLLQRVARY